MVNQTVQLPGLGRETAVNDIASSFIITAADGYEIRQQFSRVSASHSYKRGQVAHELRNVGHGEGDGHAVVVAGRFTGFEWIFSVRSESTLVDGVLAGDGGIGWPAVSHAAGNFLKTLHSRDKDHDVSDTGGPEPYLRLDAWFRGLSPDFHGAHFTPVVREVLGDSVWNTLAAWCESLLAASSTTLCHGQFGMGSIHVGYESVLEVLTGPALCAGHPSLDIGYFLGELLEMSRAERINPEELQLSIQAFEDGYGRGLVPDDFRAAILRILMHQHDFVAYAAHEVTPEIVENLRFVRYLVESGMGSR